MTAQEVNFDGLSGPTHNYAGLSYGNVASAGNARSVSNPRAAARQGLAKMKALADRGFAQAVLPPHERPFVPVLRALGFAGADAAVVEAAWRADPNLVLACSSASAMWAANAATVSPAADTADGRLHVTPANLAAMVHRAIEAPVTARILRSVFADERRFAHHPPLPALEAFGDEGAANHTRLCAGHGDPGVELFVYGRRAFGAGQSKPKRFPARQTLEASAAVARRHGIGAERAVFAQQNPDLIDAGAFHNDVVAIGNGPVLFHYEGAFVDTPGVVEEVRRKLADQAELTVVEVPAAAVPVEAAIRSYLFNSQLLTLPDGTGMVLVLPEESREEPSVAAYLEGLLASGGPIREALHFDLRQSMRNGGGPACLRLRVVLNEADRAAANGAVFLDDALHARLAGWIDRHYRDRLEADDLRDPALLTEGRVALDELTGILELGPVYDFQRE
ncbi:N-succinylarginine dihydrolase [Arenibaculum sp.]|uniref:N-succinylarginine dihydrolase n=1 Tax=Arenibaculum sp. TaxID=2865862 RepID=UPI002E10AA30|nr:N-succinylarginine dihydrolase [Arenibaculum sp.]